MSLYARSPPLPHLSIEVQRIPRTRYVGAQTRTLAVCPNSSRNMLGCSLGLGPRYQPPTDMVTFICLHYTKSHPCRAELEY
jgi:hypothetical protein